MFSFGRVCYPGLRCVVGVYSLTPTATINLTRRTSSTCCSLTGMLIMGSGRQLTGLRLLYSKGGGGWARKAGELEHTNGNGLLYITQDSGRRGLLNVQTIVSIETCQWQWDFKYPTLNADFGEPRGDGVAIAVIRAVSRVIIDRTAPDQETLVPAEACPHRMHTMLTDLTWVC